MTGAINCVEEGLTVVTDAAMLDAQAVSIRVEDDVAGAQVVRDWVADAAQVHRPHAPDNTVGRLVGVVGNDEIGVGILQVAFEVLHPPVWSDALTVVPAGRRVHAEHGGSVRQHGAHLKG